MHKIFQKNYILNIKVRKELLLHSLHAFFYRDERRKSSYDISPRNQLGIILIIQSVQTAAAKNNTFGRSGKWGHFSQLTSKKETGRGSLRILSVDYIHTVDYRVAKCTGKFPLGNTFR